MFKTMKEIRTKNKKTRYEYDKIKRNHDIQEYYFYIKDEIEKKLFERFEEIEDEYYKRYSDVLRADSDDELHEALNAYLDVLNDYMKFFTEMRKVVSETANKLRSENVDESIIKDSCDKVLLEISKSEKSIKIEITTFKEGIRKLETSDIVESANSEKSKEIIKKIKSLIRSTHNKTSGSLKSIKSSLVRLIAAIKSSVNGKIKEMKNKEKNKSE